MPTPSEYPRVLIVALGRVNAFDSYSSSLLLRNLFGDWPRDRIAQIYSSGDTGDEGFFGQYYRLGPEDRRLGRLFYRWKTDALGQTAEDPSALNEANLRFTANRSWPKRMLVDTGFYELIFTPRLSDKMRAWVEVFRPEIIFAQGYNLTFAKLPLLLKSATNSKVAFFCSDDWPTYLYSGLLGEPQNLKWFIRPIVKRATARLLDATDIPFAFGHPMAEEYRLRYGKEFTVLSHADDPRRFESASPVRVHPQGTLTIMTIGYFNEFRWPLLVDANESCRILNERGVPARIAVVSSMIDPEGARRLAELPYIDVFPDPGNEKLPSYLKGADLLLLAEGFDDGFVSAIHLSISSKAHLFMFSGRPVVVYAHSDTGIAKYAAKNGWAKVVSRRDAGDLTEAFQSLLAGRETTNALVHRADSIAQTFHTHEANRKRLYDSLSGAIPSPR